MNKTGYRIIKRSFDIAGSVLILAATCPASMAAALAVKAESHGHVIFAHERNGLNGRKIRIYKFRSMREGSEDLEASLSDEELEAYYHEYKLKNDPRVTETGRFLRRTSLDELPQLVNIIAGSMSLVGPRPVTSEELGFYDENERIRLLSVKPGLTGYWQVFGKGKATYQNGMRQDMELYYADHASLLLDALILLKTPAAVIRGNR